MNDIGTIGDPQGEPDVQFWARQFSEHALFFQLGIDNPALKADAKALHEAWERVRTPTLTLSTTLMLAQELRAYKMELGDRLNRGEWLGWIFPTFVDHTRRELDLFVAHATTAVPASVDCEAWLRFMAEHAAFAAHLMDPVEARRIRMALEFVGNFTRLTRGCGVGVNTQLLSLSKRAGDGLDKFMVGQVAKAKGIIHPVLATHVVREGRRFLRTVNMLRGHHG